MTGHKVGMGMGKKNPLDGQAMLFRMLKVGVDVPVGVNHQRFLAGNQQVGVMAQHRQVELNNLKTGKTVSVHNLVQRVFSPVGGGLGVLDPGCIGGACPKP